MGGAAGSGNFPETLSIRLLKTCVFSFLFLSVVRLRYLVLGSTLLCIPSKGSTQGTWDFVRTVATTLTRLLGCEYLHECSYPNHLTVSPKAYIPEHAEVSLDITLVLIEIMQQVPWLQLGTNPKGCYPGFITGSKGCRTGFYRA